ncbi:family 2A encapsulin nanocompartment cargo protein cysteine desulfurase [Undibacterium rugosum]|uniref:family 2A encapsulin nanocompartment cargo protein cysteine desulfurase n=1 Tax=Undibacterium rugosum TaxID=2762291 RepID=UPI001B8312F2|nr:family 2A encapsulin nanocompartment cargo protein cysteine desulfurase [Undibacterium rugosum]MBR7779182.1 cysteine desulfurase [Undibacterium rugosum]
MSTAPLPYSSGLPDPAALAQLAELANDFFATLPNGEVRPERPERQAVTGNAGALPAPALQAAPRGLPEALPASPKSGLAQGVPQGYAAALPAIELQPAHNPAPVSSPYYFLGEASAYPSVAGGHRLPDLQSFNTPTDHDLRGLLSKDEPALHSGGIAAARSSDPAQAYYFIEPARYPGPSGHHAGAVPNLAASARPPFDVHAIRTDFPILQERVNGRQLVWFDNAATTQKPQSVIDRIAYFYAHENSNIHRAAHELAARATDAYEAARKKVTRFLGAASPEEIIFVRGTTEGINLIANTWGEQQIGKDDEIIVSHLEHHANIVPWQQLAARKGAKLRVIPVDDNGQVMLSEFSRLLNSRTRLVSVTQVSNALGTVVPVAQIIELAHQAGAKVLVDGAQSVSHIRVNVQALDADFFVFSGHKLFAPTGIGVVYGKRALLEEMPPWQGGGNMIADVSFERTVYQPPPARFEAGTGNIADAVGLGAAIDYIERIGIENIARYEHDLLVYATHGMQAIPGVRLVGTAQDKASVLSFVLAGYQTEQVGKALNEEGIAVRSGHHCAQPILRRFGLEATVRPSLAFYNTCEEVDRLVAVVARLATQRRGI